MLFLVSFLYGKSLINLICQARCVTMVVRGVIEGLLIYSPTSADQSNNNAFEWRV